MAGFDWGFLVVAAWGLLLSYFSRQAGRATGSFYESLGLRFLRLPDWFYQVGFRYGGLMLALLALIGFCAPLWK